MRHSVLKIHVILLLSFRRRHVAVTTFVAATFDADMHLWMRLNSDQRDSGDARAAAERPGLEEESGVGRPKAAAMPPLLPSPALCATGKVHHHSKFGWGVEVTRRASRARPQRGRGVSP